MLTTTDFIFSYLRLQARGKYFTFLEKHIFERMTQVASTGVCGRLSAATRQGFGCDLYSDSVKITTEKH